MLADGVGNEDRAMAPASASDGDRDVGFAFLLVFRKQEVDELINVVQKLSRRLVRVHVFDDSSVGSGMRFQMWDKIRIRQKTDVEHQVGVDGHAVLESETDKRNQ